MADDSEGHIPDPIDDQDESPQDEEEIPEPFNDVTDVQNADGVPLPLEEGDEDDNQAGDEAAQMDDGDADFAPSGVADEDDDIDMGMAEESKAEDESVEADAPAAAPEKEDRPPKPPRRAFDIFIKDKKANMSEEESAIPRHQLTRKLDGQWKNLEAEERQTYEEAAEEDVERYRRQCHKYQRRHPEWEIPRMANTESSSSSSSSHDAGGHSQKKRRKRIKQAGAGGSQRKKRRAAQAANDYIDEKRARAREMRAQAVGSVAEPDEMGGNLGGGGDRLGDGFIAGAPQAVAPQVAELDKVIQQLKPSRRQDDVDPAAISGAVKVFLAKMDDAQLADRKAFRDKKPAVRKLRMLKEVSAQVRKKVLQEALLDNHILARMRDWLRPMPDGSLPNLNLRTELYSLLEILPVERDNLMESEGLGVEVMELWRHPKETVQNKRALHKLISSWLRPITGASVDYKDLADEETSALKAEQMRLRREKLRARERKFTNDAERPRARIPDQAWFDFSRRPESRRQSEAETEKTERMRSSQANPKRLRVQKRFEALGRTGSQRSLAVSGSRAVRL